MRSILVVLSILLTGLTFGIISSCGTSLSNTKKTIVASNIQLAFDASVHLSMVSKDNGKLTHLGNASGVIIGYSTGGRARILTCAHVVKRATNFNGVVIANIEDKEYPTIVLKLKEDLDLALIETMQETSYTSFVKLASFSPKKGERVWVIGSTNGVPLTITGGHLSNKITLSGTKIYMVSAPAFFGNSGGGVFNTKQELIGIFFAVQTMSLGGFSEELGLRNVPIDGGGLAVSREEIITFLGR